MAFRYLIAIIFLSMNIFSMTTLGKFQQECTVAINRLVNVSKKYYYADSYNNLDIVTKISTETNGEGIDQLKTLHDFIGTTIESNVSITRKLKIFEGHFQKTLGEAILPGVLHLDLMTMAASTLPQRLNMGIFSSGSGLELIEASKVKFNEGIFPGDEIFLKVELKDVDLEKGQLTFQGKIVSANKEKTHSTATFILGRGNDYLERQRQGMLDSAKFMITEEVNYLWQALNYNLRTVNMKTYLEHKEVLKFLPHRAPFLFVDRVQGINSVVTNPEEFSVIAEYKVRDGQLLRRAEDGKKYFYEALQIESMAQSAAFLLREMMETPSTPRFLLGSISKFESFLPIPRGSKLKIISRLKKMRKMPAQENSKGELLDTYMVVLEGNILLENNKLASVATINSLVQVPQGQISDEILKLYK